MFLLSLTVEHHAQMVWSLLLICSTYAMICRPEVAVCDACTGKVRCVLRVSQPVLEGDESWCWCMPDMCGQFMNVRVALQVTKEEYGRVGQVELGRQLVERLQEAGGKPYLIPVGGSSGVGSWGYLEAWREILDQGGDKPFTDIVMV
jgi:hypothetical protein